MNANVPNDIHLRFSFGWRSIGSRSDRGNLGRGHGARRDDSMIGDVVDHFRRQLELHYVTDQTIGSYIVLPAVMAELRTLIALRGEAPGSRVRPLLSLLAQFAEFAGWLYQDAGDLNAAIRLSRKAAEWAQFAQDYHLVAYMLARRSNLAYARGDACGVLDYAAAAREVPTKIDAKLSALARQQEARGWALLGEVDRCEYLLGQADFLLENEQSGSAVPTYLRDYNVAALRIQSAICYRRLGRPYQAASILEQELDRIPASLRRERGHVLAMLSGALAEMAEPERAARLAIAALTFARQTRSRRVLREVEASHRHLIARWPDIPAVVSLHDTVAVREPGSK